MSSMGNYLFANQISGHHLTQTVIVPDITFDQVLPFDIKIENGRTYHNIEQQTYQWYMDMMEQNQLNNQTKKDTQVFRSPFLWASVFILSLSTIQYTLRDMTKFHCTSTSKGLPISPISHSDLTNNKCMHTCRFEVVESIPENISFGDAPLPRSTFEAWSILINISQTHLDIAAYKSSLRGKHVLGGSSPSSEWGEEIFDILQAAGRERGVNIRLVENYPPKDRGDNEDGKSLVRRGAAMRRSLHFNKVFGAGTMHSKFLIADRKHFYMGSANLDWRSLSQKMELGMFVQDCPCLAEDLHRVFTSYWDLQRFENATVPRIVEPKGVTIADTTYNMDKPLIINHLGAKTELYLATSPRELNGPGRTWDLDAILATINSAQKYLYIHVMDYIPMIVYSEPQRYWPKIDDAIRTAIVDRGVEVKMLVAALHFVDQTLNFLKSLQSISDVTKKGSIQVKIFKVPTEDDVPTVIARDRRTHNKFVVTEETVIIGTSNWSGDYFIGNTGVAVVVNQRDLTNQPFIEQMNDIFIRDWESDYAHPLPLYYEQCLTKKTRKSTICEGKKDPKLFASKS